MTLDYKIITEVLQLGKDGFNDLEIASQLGFDAQELIEHDVLTIETIEDLVEEGITNAAEIAANLNLPIDYIIEIAREYGLEDVKISKDDRIRLLRRRRGVMLREKQEQKNLKKRKRKSKKNLKQEVEEVSVNAEIDALVMGGADFSVMESASGLESEEVTTYLKATNQYDLWLSQFKERTDLEPSLRKKQQKTKTGKRQPKGTIRHPKIDAIVDDGLSLREMMILSNFSNQSGPANYLKTTGQHARWKARRNEKLGIEPKKQYERIPKVDELIAQGATLEELKDAGGWPTIKEPTTYMIKTLQYTRWRIRIELPKEEKEQRKTTAENLASLTNPKYEKSNQLETAIIDQQTSTKKLKQSTFKYEEAQTVEEKAKAKTYELLIKRKFKATEKQFESLFTNYFIAQKKAIKLHKYELSHGNQLSKEQISKILKAANLDPIW